MMTRASAWSTDNAHAASVAITAQAKRAEATAAKAVAAQQAAAQSLSAVNAKVASMQQSCDKYALKQVERKAAALALKERAAWVSSTRAEALALVEAARVDAAAAAEIAEAAEAAEAAVNAGYAALCAGVLAAAVFLSLFAVVSALTKRNFIHPGNHWIVSIPTLPLVVAAVAMGGFVALATHWQNLEASRRRGGGWRKMYEAAIDGEADEAAATAGELATNKQRVLFGELGAHDFEEAPVVEDDGSKNDASGSGGPGGGGGVDVRKQVEARLQRLRVVSPKV